jgi:hypothetical protein
MPEPGQLIISDIAAGWLKPSKNRRGSARRRWCMPPASKTTRKANLWRSFGNTAVQDFLDCRQWRHQHVDRPPKASKKRDCRCC